jgi:enoyl-CoA hydratase
MAVDVRHDGAIAVVTLNRPEALNAFDSGQIERVIEAFRSLKENRAVRVVVLSGTGDRAFAAGADIKEMAELSEAEGLTFGRRGHLMASTIETLPQPVVAAVNGFALGGGCEVALACDIRIASDRAVFAQPEVGSASRPGGAAPSVDPTGRAGTSDRVDPDRPPGQGRRGPAYWPRERGLSGRRTDAEGNGAR